MERNVALTYLLPHELKDYLQLFSWSESEIPSPESLEKLLSFFESRIDAWFGYRIAPTEYEEELVSNQNGIIMLHNYPVIFVSEVKLREARIVSSKKIQYLNVDTIWEGGRSIYAPTRGDRYKVKYLAGYDPIPSQLKDCIFAFIYRFLKANPNKSLDIGDIMDFAMTPVRDLTNVGLPGGISQTYRIGDTSKTAGGFVNGGTELDKAFLPLIELRMRRTVIT